MPSSSCPYRLLFFSVAKFCPTLRDPMDCSIPGFRVPHHLLELAQVHVHCIGDAIQPSHLLLPSFPSAFNLSKHQGFFSPVCRESQLFASGGPKYWSFSFSISPSNEYSGLISFKISFIGFYSSFKWTCALSSGRIWPPWPQSQHSPLSYHCIPEAWFCP